MKACSMKTSQMKQFRTNTARRSSARAAFTLIEAIVVIIILGVIAAVVAPRFISKVGDSRQSVAKSNAESLATALKLYMTDCGSIESGAGIDILWTKPSNVEEGAWKGPYVDNADALKDPWGNEYILKVPGEHNADFDVVSYGKDGRQGGEGEDADVINGKK